MHTIRVDTVQIVNETLITGINWPVKRVLKTSVIASPRACFVCSVCAQVSDEELIGIHHKRC